MSEVETINNDSLIDYINVTIEINAEKFIGGSSYTHKGDTTLGYAVGKATEKWCNENKIIVHAGKFYHVNNDKYVLDIWFESEIDAMAFKLRWM